MFNLTVEKDGFLLEIGEKQWEMNFADYEEGMRVLSGILERFVPEKVLRVVKEFAEMTISQYPQQVLPKRFSADGNRRIYEEDAYGVDKEAIENTIELTKGLGMPAKLNDDGWLEFSYDGMSEESIIAGAFAEVYMRYIAESASKGLFVDLSDKESFFEVFDSEDAITTFYVSAGSLEDNMQELFNFIFDRQFTIPNVDKDIPKPEKSVEITCRKNELHITIDGKEQNPIPVRDKREAEGAVLILLTRWLNGN